MADAPIIANTAASTKGTFLPIGQTYADWNAAALASGPASQTAFTAANNGAIDFTNPTQAIISQTSIQGKGPLASGPLAIGNTSAYWPTDELKNAMKAKTLTKVQHAKLKAYIAGDKTQHPAEATAEHARLRMMDFATAATNATKTMNDTIGGITNGIVGSINNADKQMNQGFAAVDKSITDALKPVSTFVGGSIINLTGVVKDPVGSLFELPSTLGAMINKVNPNAHAKFEASMKALHLENLQNVPSQVMGSLDHLGKLINGITALPINFVLDIYYGCQAIMKAVQKMINDFFEGIMKMVYSVIEAIVPGLQDFLSAVFTLSQQIGGIASMFSGVNQITGFTNQISGYMQGLKGVLSNPTDLIMSFAPPGVKNGINMFNNPQQLLNQMMPPQLGNALGTLTKITGFGFNGNMGYSLFSSLEVFRGGLISGVMTGFGAQFSILSPLFTVTPPRTESYSNDSEIIVPGARPVYKGTVTPVTSKGSIPPPEEHIKLKAPTSNSLVGQSQFSTSIAPPQSYSQFVKQNFAVSPGSINSGANGPIAGKSTP